MLQKWFKFQEKGTTWRRELVGGVTTFMTMAYIVFVQPLMLGTAGMDVGSVMVATCLSSALACFVMAFLANYPIALAPGMGPNVFFAYTVVLGMGFTWQQALGATFISGTLFLVLSLFGLREAIINALPATLKYAIAVGIGLLISVIGLEWSGIVIQNPATLVGLGDLSAPPTLLSIFGIALMVSLLTLGFQAAILIGILFNLFAALLTGMVHYQGIVGPVPSISPTFFQLDVVGALTTQMLPVVFVFFLLDLFDTVGTLTAVSQEGGFLRSDGTLPRAREALLSDALGTVSGSLLGTSTVTSYIESAAGIGSGARSGMANLVTGTLFVGALFFAPLLQMVGGGIQTEGLRLYPVIAPALVVVGCLLIDSVRRIDWKDYSEAFPAFLTIILMPLTFSVNEGIAFGFISYTLLKTVQGRFRDVPYLVSAASGLFILRYILV
ncbi:MAG: NCS2 family permease [Acidobacteriota bacterium]